MGNKQKKADFPVKTSRVVVKNRDFVVNFFFFFVEQRVFFANISANTY